MRELNEKEIESVSGGGTVNDATRVAPAKQNTGAIHSAQNKSTLTPFIVTGKINPPAGVVSSGGWSVGFI